jgi:hypothetical protein
MGMMFLDVVHAISSNNQIDDIPCSKVMEFTYKG